MSAMHLNSVHGLPCAPSKRQGGFAIIAAIFLVVVLAALGGFMLTFSSAQHIASAQDVLGTRAYQAARAGMEWEVSQVLNAGAACAGTGTVITLPALADDLAPFTVKVTCAVTTAVGTNEGGTAVVVHQVVSTASSGNVGDLGYVERSLSATF